MLGQGLEEHSSIVLGPEPNDIRSTQEDAKFCYAHIGHEPVELPVSFIVNLRQDLCRDATLRIDLVFPSKIATASSLIDDYSVWVLHDKSACLGIAIKDLFVEGMPLIRQFTYTRFAIGIVRFASITAFCNLRTSSASSSLILHIRIMSS